MPHRDTRTGDLVIRIVYDGAPEAGKTTNIRVLHETLLLKRRGKLSSPGSTGRRTEFFDWRDFPGGYLEGHRLRCQLVSVPGQPSLLHRRRYLLESADAVVLVADSSPSALEENRRIATSLLNLIRRIHGDEPIGIVLQANKQDLPGALTPNVLAALLEFPEEAPSVVASAEQGVGVRECFLTAVRLAAERVRTLISLGLLEERDDHESTPESLLEGLQRAEGEPTAVASPPEDVPRVPSLQHIPTGSVWPSNVRPRLTETLERPFEWSALPRAWAPPEAFEWRTSSPERRVLTTRPSWRFAELDEARRALLEVVRSQLRLGELVPSSRGFFLARSPDDATVGWWVWMLTDDEPTLDAPLKKLDETTSSEDLEECARSLRDAWLGASAADPSLDPAWLTAHPLGYACLTLPGLGGVARTSVAGAVRGRLRSQLGDSWPDL